MFLDDALGIIRRDAAVPRSLRIHDADRTVGADAQALALRAIKRTVLARDVELLHAFLEVFPRLLTFVIVHAVGPEADEQMARELPDPELARRLGRRPVPPFPHPSILWHFACSKAAGG